ncbi:unnamed protein product [Ostreobium quekettii]|uniref:RING-type E3 ubiquitin transferase n=1 Tax=Ostreobium quekettii TaxID=121088 RepID=A0A8S1IZB2_9CHLO|nr:unnamed protein product [Ostreobium quekettii]
MGNSLSRRHHGHHGHHAQPPPAAQNSQPQGQQYSGYGPRPTDHGRFYGNIPTQYPEQYPGYRQGAGHRPAGAAAQQPTQLQQTKTIRNQVNLKKPTLRLVPRPGEGDLVTPTFKFDASAPCSVTVFFMAKEESDKACKLTTQKQDAGARVTYEKGLGHVFPPPDDDECAKTHSLDISLYNIRDLTNMSLSKTDAFPIVIRLETVTDKGAQDGHNLAELEPGCATPTWVQSQTTYACLVKEEDGTWEARPIRQKIWVENVSYELQEIYGIQDIYGGDKKEKAMALGTAGYSEDLEGKECVICLAAVRDTTVLPCRHMCMCEACARELQRQQVSRCPICRDLIESLLHIKRPEKKTGDKKEDPTVDKANEAVSAK